ncbi:MAG: hypothetical protein JSV21_10975 [Nitrospirota bacterium]|nr:MAG: hypothetical protein JSV21_10975 [Nitrospirota bacterium]
MILRSILITVLTFSFMSCAKPQTVKQDVPAVPVQEQEIVLPDAVDIEGPEVEKEQVIDRKAPPVIVERTAEDRYVILNFDDADITTVIETMGDLLSINYILAPGISGKVTIQSYKKFPVRDLFSIFQSILEMNGLTAVKNKDFYFIMTLENAKQLPVDIEKGKEVKMKMDSSLVTQIVPLEFVKAADAANLLRGIMPRGTDLIVYEPTNLLIVTARPEGLLKFMKILEAIDIPPSERENIRTFVYYVENGESKNLAGILKDIYAQQPGQQRTTTTTTSARKRVTPRQQTTTTAQPPTVIGGTAGLIEGDLTITSYDDINALIIKSSPAAFLAILETIKKLDIAPKQVLIEVMIAEVRLDDTENLGIEWLIKSQIDSSTTALAGFTPSLLDVNTVATNAPAKDFFGYVIKPGDFVAMINLLASYGRVNVLSSPHILALDNKEAKIEVGDDIPIATGLNTSADTSGTGTTLVSSGQIQYRTAGILLTVTPHISDKDNVTLKITQEYSGPGGGVNVAGSEFPSFFTRRAETSGIVKDGHTLVIGGLISETQDNLNTGLPILSKIPIIGYLFGSTRLINRKNELIIMVTPHVIRNQDEADLRTAEFQDRVKRIKKRISKDDRFGIRHEQTTE